MDVSMECDLFSKFPSGGGWWTIKHHASDRWKQCSYDTAFTSPIQNVIAVQEKADVITKKHAQEPKPKLIPLIEYMLDVIDPCSSLYTHNQKTDAVQYLRQRMFDFVTSHAHMHFGPKKSRVLAVWLSGNTCKPESQSIIIDFLVLMFGDQALKWELVLDRKGYWMKKK